MAFVFMRAQYLPRESNSVQYETGRCLDCAAPGTSVLLEAVWADILGRGTFSVLSFSYP